MTIVLNNFLLAQFTTGLLPAWQANTETGAILFPDVSGLLGEDAVQEDPIPQLALSADTAPQMTLALMVTQALARRAIQRNPAIRNSWWVHFWPDESGPIPQEARRYLRETLGVDLEGATFADGSPVDTVPNHMNIVGTQGGSASHYLSLGFHPDDLWRSETPFGERPVVPEVSVGMSNHLIVVTHSMSFALGAPQAIDTAYYLGFHNQDGEERLPGPCRIVQDLRRELDLAEDVALADIGLHVAASLASSGHLPEGLFEQPLMELTPLYVDAEPGRPRPPEPQPDVIELRYEGGRFVPHGEGDASIQGKSFRLYPASETEEDPLWDLQGVGWQNSPKERVSLSLRHPATFEGNRGLPPLFQRAWGFAEGLSRFVAR